MLTPWTAFEHIADCVVVTDMHGLVEYVNPAFEEFTGFARDEVIGKPPGSLGHAAGDILLREVATRLKDRLREGDTLARLGGDEFAIMLTGIIFVESVEKVVRTLLQTFARPFEVLGREVFSSPSVGISLYPRHGADTDELLNCADIAMYHAKEARGYRYAFFQQHMRETRLLRLT